MDDSRASTAYTAWEVDLTLEEARGRAERADPVRAGSGGPAGNARLTAWTGLVLLVLLAVEGVTLIDVRGLISWHVVVGTLLVPPALLKTASTGWRILRYYRGDRDYRAAGPPPTPLRVLGHSSSCPRWLCWHPGSSSPSSDRRPAAPTPGVRR